MTAIISRYQCRSCGREWFFGEGYSNQQTIPAMITVSSYHTPESNTVYVKKVTRGLDTEKFHFSSVESVVNDESAVGKGQPDASWKCFEGGLCPACRGECFPAQGGSVRID